MRLKEHKPSKLKKLLKEPLTYILPLGVGLVYCAGSFSLGTKNITQWDDVWRERTEQIERGERIYKRLQEDVVECYDSDGDGLELGELARLYENAGVDTYVIVGKGQSNFAFHPERLNIFQLRKAFNACDLERMGIDIR